MEALRNLFAAFLGVFLATLIVGGGIMAGIKVLNRIFNG
jgi:hypothetical protein